jgi:hypothetical protein
MNARASQFKKIKKLRRVGKENQHWEGLFSHNLIRKELELYT